jgi:hypothetical protein
MAASAGGAGQPVGSTAGQSPKVPMQSPFSGPLNSLGEDSGPVARIRLGHQPPGSQQARPPLPSSLPPATVPAGYPP